jgi:hypothetical protein
MEMQGSTARQSRNATFHSVATKSGIRTPRLRLGRAKSHSIGWRCAVSEDEALNGNGCLR